uniref:Uncharacterized protein n=1 Tax=Ixodes ricinus TaxID=34613 RepID=A0A6B0ULW6_IXORI
MNRVVFLFFDFRILQNFLLFVFYTSGGVTFVLLGRILESKSPNLVHLRGRSPQIHFFFGQERDGGNTHAFSLPLLNGQRLEELPSKLLSVFCYNGNVCEIRNTFAGPTMCRKVARRR